MSEYSVTILTDATSSYIVDADSPAEAAEKAGQLHWEASPSLCHQCSNEIELGDAVGAIVCFDGKEVLDTTWAGESVAKLAAGNDALHAEVEALRAENERLRQELAQSDCALRESRANDMANVRTLKDMWERHEALRQELEAIKGQEPVLWFRSLIGAQCKPDGRCYDVVFSPCEGFIPLYALPPASHDQDGT